MDQSQLFERATHYVKSTRQRLKILKRLGFGQDGAVWLTNQRTAIKAFERFDNYTREAACYQRLAEHKISRLNEFRIPHVIGQDVDLHVIEMSVVVSPYLLDFGKAYIDIAPDFSADVLEEWEAQRAGLFEPKQWPRVKSLLSQLQSFGIYYYDAKPGNISFGNT